MPTKTVFTHVALGAILALSALKPAIAGDVQTPVVAELYTSQGCNSCPPADAILAELSARKEVIALSFHVDYWDYLGWADPFASHENTERQRAYGEALGGRGVYTPQLVVQGGYGLVGSRQSAVDMALESYGEKPLPAAVTLKRDGDRLTIRVAAQPDAGAETGEIWLFGYDGPLTQEIGRGELAGHTLTYQNVVQETRSLGAWSGKAAIMTETIDPALKGYAVIVQRPGAGPILGAAKSEFGGGA